MTVDPADTKAPRVRDTVPPLADEPSPAHPATSVLEFLDQVVADPEKTSNAQKLLTSSSTAISRIVLSFGLIVVVAAAAVSNYAGLATAASGGIAIGATSALGLAAWTIRKTWKRRARK